MTARQRYLIATATFTLLFMILVLAGSYLLSIESTPAGKKIMPNNSLFILISDSYLSVVTIRRAI